MNFQELLLTTIDNKLSSIKTIEEIILTIEKHVEKGGQFSFFPCSRYSRMIIQHIRDDKPNLLKNLNFCFDVSTNVVYEDNIHIDTIDNITKQKDLLLIYASNTFFDIEKLNYFDKNNIEYIKTSYFDYSLPKKDGLINKIKTILDNLADEKSKNTYLMNWISRVLNDENSTHLFEKEIHYPENDIMEYNNFKISYVSPTCQKELFSKLYEMKYVKAVEGDVVFDIGGYKGDTAIYFADLVKNSGKVHVFEPTKGNFEDIKTNIKNNSLENIITPVHKGCSNYTGLTKMVTLDCGVPWAFISDDIGTEEISLITIDDYVQEQSIEKLNFIKMDVEGLEYNVLEGAKKTIETFKPKMVVPLYHNSFDLIDIPMLFIEKYPNYKLYVRANMEGPYSINLYCKV